MSKYELYIVLEGLGHSEHHRSHWSFAFHYPGTLLANVHQVLLLNDTRRFYHYDRRDGVPHPTPGSEGKVLLARLTVNQCTSAQEIISRELPPRNGKDRCQDWILNCVIALEVAELIEPGASEFLGGCVGLDAATVLARFDAQWTVA
ncbi:hypothetical protein P280DRAFT_551345 [Massarina eburnea CBS 473.64]|uniref:Uncharacterized protein n=1 Tax=Massarina eburnea CBS 473.64 TaxID=1395130 RepID=A0A6A6RRU4_9PLEO|nr:hypothetical protein P280DRAFT_551345 [Massarina eburnea CBS 473.64]